MRTSVVGLGSSVFGCLALFAVLLVAAPAAAQSVAPGLAAAGRRHEAEIELQALARALPPEERHAVRGVYVAFDPSPADAYALAACDDDGDYVVVVSDALLLVLEHFSRARAVDPQGARSLRYAEAVARTVHNTRIMPPPPGFFGAPPPPREAAAVDARQLLVFREALAWLLARELVHMVARDRTCARPTEAREAGDAVWTRAERDRAFAEAPLVYGGRDLAARDRAATALAGAAGRGPAGARAFAAFVDAVAARSPSFGYAFVRANAVTASRT
jgi:hypothetical protein